MLKTLMVNPMKNLSNILWLSELFLALLIMFGIADSTMAYISLFALLFGIWKLSDVDALRFYICSIPIFVALPANALSDAMSVWRFALLFFVLKIALERFKVREIFRKKDLDFAGKIQNIIAEFKSFLRGIKSAGYYDVLYPTLLFGVAGAFSLLFAQSIGAGIKKMIFLYSVFLFFGVVWFVIKNKDDAMRVLRSLFLSGAFVLLVGYVQFISTFFVRLYDFWGLWGYVINAFYGDRTRNLLSYSNTWFSYYGDEIPPTLRMFSVMPDSHSFSILMILFMPPALYFAYAARKKSEKRKYYFVFLLMMLAVWFSGSRGAWVGWLGALAAVAYFYFYQKVPGKLQILKMKNYAAHKKLYKIIAVSLLTFVVLFPVCNFFLSESQDCQLRLEGKAVSEENRQLLLRRTLSISDMNETSNKGRKEIWYDSAISVMRHPVTGVGIGNFPLALGEKVANTKIGASAHNIYLDVAVEMGIFGFLAFAYLVWKICEKLFYTAQKFREKEFHLLTLLFFVSFVWIFTYGFFDVVIFNDKVLNFAVIILAVLYRMGDLEEKGTLMPPGGGMAEK